MQVVNTILALTIAATSVLGAPGADVGKRQASEFVTVELWTGNNCDGTLLAVNTYVDDPDVACDVPTIGLTGVQSFRVTTNTSNKPLRFYQNPNCLFQFPNTGRFTPIAALQTTPAPDCRSQPVNSVGFAPFPATE